MTEPLPVVRRALEEAVRFLEYRDRMNAHIHLAEPRWSPITDLVREGLEAYSSGLEEPAELAGAEWMTPELLARFRADLDAITDASLPAWLVDGARLCARTLAAAELGPPPTPPPGVPRGATDVQKRMLYALLREGHLDQVRDGAIDVEGLTVGEASRLIGIGVHRRARLVGFAQDTLCISCGEPEGFHHGDVGGDPDYPHDGLSDHPFEPGEDPSLLCPDGEAHYDPAGRGGGTGEDGLPVCAYCGVARSEHQTGGKR